MTKRADGRRSATLIDDISRLCLDHPLRERLWASLITAHYRTGNQAEALRCNDRLRLALIETSGVDTEVEGSTAVWAHDDDAMGASLPTPRRSGTRVRTDSATDLANASI